MASQHPSKDKLIRDIIGLERRRFKFYAKNKEFTKEEIDHRFKMLMNKNMQELDDIYDNLLYWFDKYIIFPLSQYYSGRESGEE